MWTQNAEEAHRLAHWIQSKESSNVMKKFIPAWFPTPGHIDLEEGLVDMRLFFFFGEG